MLSPPQDDVVLAPNPEKGPAAIADPASTIEAFFQRHPEAAVLEDGKVLFELARAQFRVASTAGQCTLQLWDAQRHAVRSVLAAEPRRDTLRLRTRRVGHKETKTLTLMPALERREPNRREPARQAYARLLQRVLARELPDWQAAGFRTAMDLERSFGPAYTRGSLVRGREAWAVIGVGAAESQAVVDGILTLGILWLETCREHAAGNPLYRGLRLVVPAGRATLTLSRLPWINHAAAQWELYELDESSEALLQRDAGDHGNLRTRLVHLPNRAAAQERFADAIAAVMALVPAGQEGRVEQRLRSPVELAFLLHGLEFATARISLAPSSFAHVLEIRVGAGREAQPLSPGNAALLAVHVAELFARRHPARAEGPRPPRPHAPGRGIGTFLGRPAHARLGPASTPESPPSGSRWERRRDTVAPQADPLFRAAPERWLESVLRENLAPLTRSLAPVPGAATGAGERFANDDDPDTRGNRADPAPQHMGLQELGPGAAERLIPRFDPRFVYTQVPAIAGAGDRGMLDLLGVTGDGRLAVLEIKAADDLQLVLQGLDYWIRVRHHCAPSPGTGQELTEGLNDLQRHGYFSGVALSPLPPRLYLVAPALHIHPAVETVLRFLSPAVEWTLLALDERWRHQVRVVWRKSGGSPMAK